MRKKDKYKKMKIDGAFYKIKSFYLFFMPIKVPYDEIVEKAEDVGYKLETKKNGKIPGILEKCSSFGFGWIGVQVKETNHIDEQLERISGNFTTFEHKGSYRNIRSSYKQVMRDHPGSTEFYNLYLNDPKNTKEKDLRTLILFR